jgi:hypothetical protein
MFAPLASVLAHFLSARLTFCLKLLEFGELFGSKNTLHLSAHALPRVLNLAV